MIYLKIVTWKPSIRKAEIHCSLDTLYNITVWKAVINWPGNLVKFIVAIVTYNIIK